MTISAIKSSVAKVAGAYDIKKVSLFGSYAHGTQKSDSDIDLLVEFGEPSVSLFRLAGIKLRLEELTGKSVDVIHSPIPYDSLIEIDKEVVLYER